jgi:glutathione S-transferase
LVPRLDEARFGIGHIAAGCALGYLDFRFTNLDWRATRPALAAWQTRFKARPSAIATEVRDA